MTHFGTNVTHFGTNVTHFGTNVTHFGTNVTHFGTNVFTAVMPIAEGRSCLVFGRGKKEPSVHEGVRRWLGTRVPACVCVLEAIT
jgi:hypothetical protein